MSHFLKIAAFIGSLLTPVAYAEPVCSFTQIASLPLLDTDYTITTKGQIEGNDLSFLIDTGSEGSLLTTEALARFELSPDNNLQTLISGPDGRGHIVPSLTISSLSIGDLRLHDQIFPIGDMPGAPLLHPPLLGLIGMDILGQYDLDFDLPHSLLTLWHVHAESPVCMHPPRWPASNHEKEPVVLVSKQEGNRFLVPFILDGHKGMALLDSGARSHILSLSFAHKIGLSDDRLAQDPGGYSAAIGSKERRYQWHKFHHLMIGNERTQDPVLTIAPTEPHIDMLLGADWFKTHHIWISATTRQIYSKR